MLACIATTACLLARRPHRVPGAADRPAGTRREQDQRELRVTAAARPFKYSSKYNFKGSKPRHGRSSSRPQAARPPPCDRAGAARSRLRTSNPIQSASTAVLKVGGAARSRLRAVAGENGRSGPLPPVCLFPCGTGHLCNKCRRGDH